MSGQGSLATFFKSLFYKTCFCIGLGTVSYYSYGQVQKWTSPTFAPPTVESSTIQDKVDSLTAPSVNGSTTVTQSVHQNPTEASWTERHFAKFKSLVIPEAKKADASLDPLVGAMAEASPSPSVSPSPGEATAKKDDAKDGDKKDGDKKDGEKKDGEEKPETELTSETPPAPVGPTAYAINPEVPAEAQVTASPAAPNLPDLSGTMPIANGALSHTSYGSASGSGGSGNSTNNPAASSLTTADVSMLSSSIKAIFGDITEDVNGQLCSAGATPNSVTGCVPHNKYQIHTDRWSTAYGLLPDVGFSISSAGETQIKVSLTLKVQDLSQITQTISVSVTPSEVISHIENRSGTYYKIFDIKLPDTTVLGNDRLSGMTATLVYAENAPPAVGGSLTTDSNFVFTRTKVQTTASVWDFTGQNRAPAANEQVMVADSIGYTIKLQKSP